MERVRGKFFVLGIEKYYLTTHDVTVKLGAVAKGETEDAENTYFHKATPSGEIRMSITNPAAAEFFHLGDVFYVDFIRAQQ